MIQVWRFIETSNSISRTQFIFTMFNGLQCLPVKVNFSNLCIRFSNMRSSTFETNSPLSRNSHVGQSILIHRLTQIRHVDLFKYFIEEVRFGTWKGCCRLNWALTPFLSILAMFVCRVKQSKHPTAFTAVIRTSAACKSKIEAWLLATKIFCFCLFP